MSSTRREFVKLTCSLCAAVTGIGIAATFLQSCSSIPLIKASADSGKISVAESALKDHEYILVRVRSMENDILLIKHSPLLPQYWALLMQCTHQQQPLTVQGQILHCAAHGSEFNLEGAVIKEPALQPLKRYTATAANGMITIDLNS